ncbi:MAG: tyrosine-type recombinase/integrase [Deltaproteobacteria bacterium]|jgi:integrase|nr:tyrosine-type recombinase/integrase [Deltaproteobacteria bacterium]
MPQAAVPIRDIETLEKFIARLAAGRNGDRDAALFVTGVNAALRISDLLALTVESVRAPDGNIREKIWLVERKTNRRRSTHLNAAARGELARYLATRPGAGPNEPLFPSSQDPARAITTRRARAIFREAADALGLERVSTHSMRKSFGYHLYRDTAKDLALVQKALGHRTSDITLRYIGLDDADVDAAVDRLGFARPGQ